MDDERLRAFCVARGVTLPVLRDWEVSGMKDPDWEMFTRKLGGVRRCLG